MSDIIRIGHSPDPDDAFMFYAMLNNKIDNLGLNIEECVEDIESLNNRTLCNNTVSYLYCVNSR